MKALMRLLSILAILLLLVVIVAVYLVVTFDPNAYKSQIEERFSAATGRELTLAGRIELTLFPSLGLRIEDVRVANAGGFGDDPFAELRVVDVAVAALPLLRGEVDVQRVDGDGVRLRLARRDDGRGNWEDLLGTTEAVAQTGGVGPARGYVASSEGASTGFGGRRILPEDIRVAGLSLTNLHVDWDDRAQGMRMTIAPANLRVRGLRANADSPVRFDGYALLEPDEGEPSAIRIDLEALLNLGFPSGVHQLHRARSDIMLQLPGIEDPIGVRIETDLVLDLPGSTLRVEPLSAVLSDLRVDGAVRILDLGAEQPRVQAGLRSNRFSPRAVLEHLGQEVPKTADPDALAQMSFEVSVSGTARALTFDPLVLAVDESTLRGQASVDLSGPRPFLRFTIAGDRLDLDRYLPPEVEEARAHDREPSPVPMPPETPEAVEPDPDPSDRPDVPIDLPVALMHALDVDGLITLDRLTLLGLLLERIELALKAREGDWRVEPLTGTGYQGRIESRASLDARTEPPRFRLDLTLDGVAIAPLLEDLREGESRLLGTGSLVLGVAAAGDSVAALTASLNGQGRMDFVNGAVRGINIARIIRDADARLRGQIPQDDGEPNQTDFSELRGSFRIVDGVVRNDDLTANSPLLRVAGRGSADLPRRMLDYRVDTTLVASLEGQGGRSLDELRGVNLPIRVTGAFDAPRFRLDLEDVVRERIEDRAKREVEKLQDRLLERLGGPRDSEAGAGPDSRQQGDRSDSLRLDQSLDRLRDQLRGRR